MCECTDNGSINKPHVHAALIKAWADGAEIQVRKYKTLPWEDPYQPVWNTAYEYRIKPQPKPDVVFDCLVTRGIGSSPRIVANALEHISLDCRTWDYNMKAIFDGETGKLKNVEMIK